MLDSLFAPKFIVLYAFIASAMSSPLPRPRAPRLPPPAHRPLDVLAPYNALMYMFSAVPNRPFVDVDGFPSSTLLTDNWRDDPRRGDAAVRRGPHPRCREVQRPRLQLVLPRAAGSASTSSGTTSRCPRRRRCARRPSSSCSRSRRQRGDVRAAAAGQQARRAPRSVRRLAALSPGTRHAEFDERCRIIVDGEPYSWRDGEAGDVRRDVHPLGRKHAPTIRASSCSATSSDRFEVARCRRSITLSR